ncbi:MAG TPA: hypothetical protein VFJ43_15450 [Bacteroidia bacterium]|nr:hypothetical protein [Bacteroidia bacterium]
MDDLNRPVFGLSVREYVELNRKIISEELQKLLFDQKKRNVPDDNDIIFLEDVMRITGYTKSTVYTKTSRFEMPVISRKKPLTFSRKEIMDWMRDGKPTVVGNQAEQYLFKKKIA